MRMKTKIMLFEEFLNEAYIRDEFQKVMITRRAELKDSFITGPKYTTKDYWVILTGGTEPIEVPKDLPVLNYDRKTLSKLVDAGAIKDTQVYNKLEAREKVSSKAEFYKAHANSGYIIPTVYKIEDVKKLNFPIVAKPDNNHSGLGIKVFNSIEDLNGIDGSEFSSFSEKITIKEEHRFFIWRGQVIQWTERKPMDEETKDIAKKDSDSETNFAYILRNETPADEYLKAIAYFGDYHSDLDFYAIDIAKDDNNKLYVFEINSEPGALFGVMAIVYQKIWEDWNKEQMPEDTVKLLKKFRQQDIEENKKQNANWKVK